MREGKMRLKKKNQWELESQWGFIEIIYSQNSFWSNFFVCLCGLTFHIKLVKEPTHWLIISSLSPTKSPQNALHNIKKRTGSGSATWNWNYTSEQDGSYTKLTLEKLLLFLC